MHVLYPACEDQMPDQTYRAPPITRGTQNQARVALRIWKVSDSTRQTLEHHHWQAVNDIHHWLAGDMDRWMSACNSMLDGKTAYDVVDRDPVQVERLAGMLLAQAQGGYT